MKRIILLALLALPLAAYAEGSEGLLSAEDRIWTMRYQTIVNPEEYGEVFTYTETRLSVDTIIGGITFKKEYTRTKMPGEEQIGEWEATARYLGQEGGKIYEYNIAVNQTRLLMDFGLHMGDIVRLTDYAYQQEAMTADFRVIAVSDTILPGQTAKERRRCLYIQDTANPLNFDVWVEGIGSLTYGIIGNMFKDSEGVTALLLQCRDRQGVLYDIDGQTNSIYDIDDKPSLSRAKSFFDLQGRRQDTAPRKGVYIRGGKKRVAR